MLSNRLRSGNGISIYRKIWRVVLIGLIVFAGWAASPLFYNRTVDEAFPAPAAPTTVAAAAMPAVMASAPAAAAMPDVMASMPAAAPTAVAAASAPDLMATMQAADIAADTDVADVMMAERPVPTPAPAGPIALQSGSFVDGSLPGHHAAGSATVFRLENGQQVVRLEDFEATNGPDLFVTFHTGANPETDRGDYFQVAPLKGNLGDQNYELPADFELGQYKSVVIWCRTFNVVFGYAALQPAP